RWREVGDIATLTLTQPVYSTRSRLRVRLHRTWLVAFWTFVTARHAATPLFGPILVSVVFSLLAMPASILGNEAALRFGRHRALTLMMLASAAVAIAIGLSVEAPPTLLLALLLLYAFTVAADSGALTSRMAMRAMARDKGATMAMHTTIGFGLSGL